MNLYNLNLYDGAMSERGQFDNMLSQKQKQIDVSFPCICPVIDHEFNMTSPK